MPVTRVSLDGSPLKRPAGSKLSLSATKRRKSSCKATPTAAAVTTPLNGCSKAFLDTHVNSWHLLGSPVGDLEPSLPCLIFGGFMLLRLLAKLPNIFSSMKIRPPNEEDVLKCLEELVVFLEGQPQFFQ